MMRSLVPVLLAVLVAVAAPGCKKEQTATDHSGGKLLARVNTTTITEGDLARWMGGAAHGQTATPEVQSKMVDRLIDLELLYQNGVELGLDKDVEFQSKRAKVKQDLKIFDRIQIKRLVVEKAIAPKVQVTDDMARKYFEEHRAEIQNDWHFYSLQFPTEEEAQAALAEIKGGVSFETLANRLSQSKLGQPVPRWDNGFVPWARIPPEWHDAVFKLKLNELSDVVRSRDAGIRIVKLVGSRPRPSADFDLVSDDIAALLREQLLLTAADDYLAQLRQEASIERFDQAQ
jgi:parvulin-like peptidyl-prolyl isomerase